MTDRFEHLRTIIDVRIKGLLSLDQMKIIEANGAKVLKMKLKLNAALLLSILMHKVSKTVRIDNKKNCVEVQFKSHSFVIENIQNNTSKAVGEIRKATRAIMLRIPQ